MKFIIENKASAELGIMLEPWCNRVDVAPGGKAQVEFEPNDEPIQVDMHDETFLSLWVPAGTKFSLVD